VQATALTGLGQVVTGAFVLILISWWIQHARSARRARRNGQAVRSKRRHPTTQGSSSSGAEGSSSSGEDGDPPPTTQDDPSVAAGEDPSRPIVVPQGAGDDQ